MRFHVEHLREIIETISPATGITDRDMLERLASYCALIFDENKKYNLTGHKSTTDIALNLIAGSLTPLNLEDVPRGTSLADMGTGAGVPGIPLAIRYPDLNLTLFDSTGKKISFIETAAGSLGIKNVRAVCARIEDLAGEKTYREAFDIVVSRAMSDVYMAGELCSQFIKVNGLLYLYVSDRQKNLEKPVIEHLSRLNLRAAGNTPPLSVKTCGGLLLKKTGKTSDTYPRRITAIKRGISEFEKGTA